MTKITMIKPDATVKIEIGSGFLEQLQIVLLDLINSRTDEEVLLLAEAIGKQEQEGEDFPEQWMENIYIITKLIAEIEKALIAQGFTYEQDLEESIEDNS
jgi:hypothetical protein